MRLILLIAAFAMVSCSITDHAPTSGSLPFDEIQEARIRGLRGIKAVRILVFGTSILQLGFSGRAVEDEIIDRAEKAGITVEQVTSDRTIPNVVIDVTRGYSLPYNVEIRVEERALLLRDLSREVSAITWEESEPAGTASEVKDRMLQLADEFIKSFKLANPDS